MQKETNTLDLIKAVACVLIIGSHCLPIFKCDSLNFYYGQCFFRFCVPLYFISTGYYFAKMEGTKQKAYIKRIVLLYISASLLYAPFYTTSDIGIIISKLLFGFHHLWYLSALVMGLIITVVAQKFLKTKKYILIILLVGGIVLNEYYKLINNESLLRLAVIVSFCGGAKHALLFATPMLLVGDYIAGKHVFAKKSVCIFLFVILLTASFIETAILKNQIGSQIRLDVSIFEWTPAIPLFLLGLNTKAKIEPVTSRKLRKITDIAYIIHVWIIVLVVKLLKLEFEIRFLIVTVVSFVISCIIYGLITIMRKDKNTK